MVHQAEGWSELELPAKVARERLRHSSVLMTMDRYGHVFRCGDDSAELAEAERAFFASTRHKRGRA